MSETYLQAEGCIQLAMYIACTTSCKEVQWKLIKEEPQTTFKRFPKGCMGSQDMAGGYASI